MTLEPNLYNWTFVENSVYIWASYFLCWRYCNLYLTVWKLFSPTHFYVSNQFSHWRLLSHQQVLDPVFFLVSRVSWSVSTEICLSAPLLLQRLSCLCTTINTLPLQRWTGQIPERQIRAADLNLSVLARLTESCRWSLKRASIFMS